MALPPEETMSTLGEAKAKEKQQTAEQLLIRSLGQQNVKYIQFQRSARLPLVGNPGADGHGI
jgi:hypothetical protein